MIQIDRKPGRKQLRRNGEVAGPIKPPGPAEPIPTLRVRMLRDINCKLGSFAHGKAYQLPVNTARSWIGFGFAEEDKALDSAPETK
jgi:hypothetical protein